MAINPKDIPCLTAGSVILVRLYWISVGRLDFRKFPIPRKFGESIKGEGWCISCIQRPDILHMGHEQGWTGKQSIPLKAIESQGAGLQV